MPARLHAPEIEWRDGLPWSVAHQDWYASHTGARAEREHVFLRGHGFAAAGDAHPGRWAGPHATTRTHATPHTHSPPGSHAWPGTSGTVPARFTFGELGFGAGVSFLVTWAAFRAHALPRDSHAVLEWVSVEGMPLDATQLVRAAMADPAMTGSARPGTAPHAPAGTVPGAAAGVAAGVAADGAPPTVHHATHAADLRPLVEELARVWPPRTPGVHRRTLDGGRVALTLLFGAPLDELPRMSFLADAWNLDGFAPARNPDMWAEPVMEQVAMHARHGTTVATYSAAAAVRQALTHAGFRVEPRPGVAGKRDTTIAHWPHPAPRPPVRVLPGAVASPAAHAPPHARSYAHADAHARTHAHAHSHTLPAWCAQPAGTPDAWRDGAIVIGAGLAGAAAARALAERGITVRVLDAGAVASGGSGAPRAILAPHLANWHGVQARVVAHAFLHARALLERLRIPCEPCGVLHPLTDEDAWAHETALEEWGWPPEMLRIVPAREAAALAGVPGIARDAVWVPSACAVQPAQVVRALLAHPRITTHTHTHATLLRRTAVGWQVATNGSTPRGAHDMPGRRTAEHAGARVGGAATHADSHAQEFEAPLVVLATAGAWAPRMEHGRTVIDRTAPLAATALPHAPFDGTRGQLTLLRCAAPGPRTVLAGGGFVVPAGHDEFYAGATHERGNDSLTPTARDDALNMIGAERLLPGAGALEPVGAWVGLRATVNDHLPLVGAVPDEPAFRAAFAALCDGPYAARWPAAPLLPGLFCTLAHGSRGTSTALLAGELLADIATGATRCIADDLLPALLPQRFLVRALRRGDTPQVP